jgi:hypothetical protein
MDGAGTNDNKDTIVLSCQNAGSVVTGRCNGELRRYGGLYFMPEKSRLNQGVIL